MFFRRFEVAGGFSFAVRLVFRVNIVTNNENKVFLFNFNGLFGCYPQYFSVK